MTHHQEIKRYLSLYIEQDSLINAQGQERNIEVKRGGINIFTRTKASEHLVIY